MDFFLPLKAKKGNLISLSLSFEHKTPNHARCDEKKDKLSLTSLFVFFFFVFERARREHKFYYSLCCIEPLDK